MCGVCVCVCVSVCRGEVGGWVFLKSPIIIGKLHALEGLKWCKFTPQLYLKSVLICNQLVIDLFGTSHPIPISTCLALPISGAICVQSSYIDRASVQSRD